MWLKQNAFMSLFYAREGKRGGGRGGEVAGRRGGGREKRGGGGEGGGRGGW